MGTRRIFLEGDQTAGSAKNRIFFGMPKVRSKIFEIKLVDVSAEGGGKVPRYFYGKSM